MWHINHQTLSFIHYLSPALTHTSTFPLHSTCLLLACYPSSLSSFSCYFYLLLFCTGKMKSNLAGFVCLIHSLPPVECPTSFHLVRIDLRDKELEYALRRHKILPTLMSLSMRVLQKPISCRLTYRNTVHSSYSMQLFFPHHVGMNAYLQVLYCISI